MDDILAFLLYFLEIILYTLGVFVICGLVVALCERLFRFFMGDGAGYKFIIATSVIGTPVHELGHALMCIVFGHKIVKMKLWQPKSPDGTLGYVSHSYNRRNIYQKLGNLFIGIGPVFSGLGVITLLLFLCFPESLGAYFDETWAMVSRGTGILEIAGSSASMLWGLFSEESVAVYWRILAVVVILCICLHVNLSIPDIKSSLGALPIYLIPVFLTALVTMLFGENVTGAVKNALSVFALYMTKLFSIVIAFSVALVLFSFVIFLIRKLMGAVAHGRA